MEKCYYDGTPPRKGIRYFQKGRIGNKAGVPQVSKMWRKYFTEEQTRELREKLKQVRAEIALTQVPDNLLTVPGKILKAISERGEMPVSLIVEEVVNDYGNPKVARTAVSRALRQLEAQGLVKVETSRDRRIKVSV